MRIIMGARALSGYSSHFKTLSDLTTTIMYSEELHKPIMFGQGLDQLL